MKILILTERFFPEEFLINDLAAEWRSAGHEVEVLTQVPSYPWGPDFQRLPQSVVPDDPGISRDPGTPGADRARIQYRGREAQDRQLPEFRLLDLVVGAGERLALRPGVRLSYRAAIHGQRGDDIPLCLVAEVHDLDAGCLAGHSLQLRHQADAARCGCS